LRWHRDLVARKWTYTDRRLAGPGASNRRSGILARMTLFPGLRQCAAERHLRVLAEASRVMGWLTDPGRREREWLRQVEAQEDIDEPSVARLPNGGLRFDYLFLRRGNVRQRHTTEDVAIQEHRIDRVHRARLTGPRAIPLRWELQQCVTVEPAGEATDVTVRIRGQMAGISRVLHLLGWRDTTTARFLTGEASRGADSFVSAVAAQFTESSQHDVSTDTTA
jgi:hypothetical protein